MSDSMMEFYGNPSLQMIDWRKAFQDNETLLSVHLRSSFPPYVIYVQWRRDETKIGAFARGMNELIYSWKPSLRLFGGGQVNKSVDFADQPNTKFTPTQLRNKLSVNNLHEKDGYIFTVPDISCRVTEEINLPKRLNVTYDVVGYMKIKSYVVYSDDTLEH